MSEAETKRQPEPAETDRAAPEPPPKKYAQPLDLRPRLRPVVRFRRWLIVTATGVATIAVVGVTWLALQPAGVRLASTPEEQRPSQRVNPDVLASAPASYGDVPRLGPPLPGDLGRPILEQQRQNEQNGIVPSAAPVAPMPPVDPAIVEAERARAVAAAEAERGRAAAEAARTSPILAQLGGGTAAGRGGGGNPVIPMPTDSSTSPSLSMGMINGRSFATEDENANRLRAAPSPWTLSAGTIIAASLITGLNSDVPGIVLAQVTEPVRDTATGRTILIPQGSRLIGNYENVVAFGQRRALVAWQRIILPNGSSIRLDEMPAADASGYAGLEDNVDFHTWRLLQGIGLSTLLGVGTELTLGENESDLVRALRESAQTNMARAGDQITRRNLDVQPTIRIRQGWPVRAIVNRDLVLEPWRG